MKAHAIKYKDGWFIRDLPGFEAIQSNVISLNVDLSESQWNEMGYKELKGVTIMERYAEKKSREVSFDAEISDIQREFRRKFEISECSLIEGLKGQ